MLDPHGPQSKAQQTVGQLPGTTGATVHMADQHFVIVLAGHSLQPASHLP